MSADHVVFDLVKCCFHCKRCGATREVWTMEISALAKISEEFLAAHRECK